ncbi:gsl1256 [Gloeobacter violaceus PCC 7421]|uniref:Gsl1256 protein n=2 Tax=Gloeobacter violaceus TaxID=33072 RepID=Q7NL70_GLOVI|nr:gsl1256 [Gloeobacter violaceus PCC 7421]
MRALLWLVTTQGASMSDPPAAPASEQEIEAVIAELEQYRRRIIDDALHIAKLAKVPKQVTMGHLEKHPEIHRIDAMLTALRAGEPFALPASTAE